MTAGANRVLDYSYSIFGFQTGGQSVIQTLDGLPTTVAVKRRALSGHSG